MKPSARLYHCLRCHCQVIVCRSCDRGHVYCTQGCAEQARSDSRRRSARRYQNSRRGRFNNADRQRRYRQRQREKVTHQGSPPVIRSAVLPRARRRVEGLNKNRPYPLGPSVHCHICRRECSRFLRLGYRRSQKRHRSRSTGDLRS